MQTKPYSSVISGVQALVGATLESAELLRMAATINSRARRAYEAFDLWPRWLVIGEFRFVDGNKTIPDTITGENTVDTFLRVHEYDPWDNLGSKEWDFNADSTGARLVNYSFAFNNTLDSFEFGTSTGKLITGITTNPAHGLIVGDRVKLDSVGDALGNDLPAYNLEYTVSAVPTPTTMTLEFLTIDGTLTDVNLEGTILIPKVYATYKQALDITYGDGVADATDTTTIPLEWFEYIVRGTYADWLRSEGQTEKAIAEDSEANKILSEQIERADNSQSHPVYFGQG
jgi:hypothetical protein